MVVAAYIIGEYAALVGVSGKAAVIAYIVSILLAVAVCYGLILVGKPVTAWNKAVFCFCAIAVFAGYDGYKRQESIYQYYDELQYGEDVCISVTGEVVAITEKEYYDMVELETGDGYVQLQLETAGDIRYGETLAATGTVIPMNVADNQGNYDEKSYLHGNGVILKLKVEEEAWSKTGGEEDYSFIRDYLYRVKKRAIEILGKQCDEKEMGLLSAIVLGEKTYMDDDIKELYSSQGIAHVTAISGLHISVIGMGLYSLMRKRMRYISSATVSALVMILFSAMAGNPVSAVRAVIMFVMHVVADVLGRKYDMLSAISLSAFILLFDNPFYITNASFILSYLAMIAVSVTAPVVTEFFRAKNALVKTMLFNISLTFTSMPINSCLFYRLSTYSVVINLMVVPLMGIMLTMAIVGMLVSAFAEGLGVACFGTSVYILRFYEWLCTITEGLPKSSVVTGNIETWQIATYYGLLTGTLFIMWRYSIRRESVKEVNNKKANDKKANDKEINDKQKNGKEVKSNKEKKLIFTFGTYACKAIVAICTFLMIYIVYHQKNNEFTLYFLDVGQGDCAYVHSASGNDYLIDCGSTDEKNVGKYKLESFLEYKDVESLEGIFISHCDTDHISGILELIEHGNIGVDTIFLPDTERINPSENGIALVELALEHGISVKYFAKGSSYMDGELKFVCISPDTDKNYEDINEASMVLMMRYENIQVMYAGDIGASTEKGILEEVEAFMNETKYSTDEEITTIYKVAHHGSKYSNSEELLELLQPDIAVISCGADNSYGHPHAEALSRIREDSEVILITAERGGIEISLEEKLLLH